MASAEAEATQHTRQTGQAAEDMHVPLALYLHLQPQLIEVVWRMRHRLAAALRIVIEIDF